MNQHPKNIAAPDRIWALIPCAGRGARSGAQGLKQYEIIAGKPMVLHTLDAFLGVRALSGILVVVSLDDNFFHQHHAPVLVAACGGSTRAMTVLNGLSELIAQGAEPTDWVLVHDAARCLITAEQIEALIEACLPDVVGGLLAVPLPDTLKSEQGGRVHSTVARADKWLAQTPQMFRIADLTQALYSAGDAVTDESSAMEAMGLQPLLVPGSVQNFKVTYPHDFALAHAVLSARCSARQA